MTQGQSIAKGDALQRISSAGFILAAILLAVSGLMMPHANTPTSDLQQMLKQLGEHEFLTQLSSLLMAIGFWAALLGTTGIYRSINAVGSAWALVGFYFTLIADCPLDDQFIGRCGNRQQCFQLAGSAG